MEPHETAGNFHLSLGAASYMDGGHRWIRTWAGEGPGTGCLWGRRVRFSTVLGAQGARTKTRELWKVTKTNQLLC